MRFQSDFQVVDVVFLLYICVLLHFHAPGYVMEKSSNLLFNIWCCGTGAFCLIA